ncbi:MAG: 50S ribosomal protein L21 [Candidatus Omnitrophica bacterium]|nr:50S ribosomal protein L21 [Candidatus Omnitrophota bacterium]
MFAVIEVGGKQQIISEGQVILVEKQNAGTGETITLDKVLLVADGDNVKIGKPYLEGVSVEAVVLAQEKGPKKITFKYRRRKSSHTKKGHRQQLTRLEIKKIKV